MFQTEHLQEKWQPVLEHPDLPRIEDSYKEKLETLKENYFPKVKTVVAETVDNVETGTAVQDITEGSPMAKYMTAIGKTAVSNGN